MARRRPLGSSRSNTREGRVFPAGRFPLAASTVAEVRLVDEPLDNTAADTLWPDEDEGRSDGATSNTEVVGDPSADDLGWIR